MNGDDLPPRNESDEKARTSRSNRSWHSRGYLPHFDASKTVQGVTFRLADAVPDDLVRKWKQDLRWRADVRADDPVALELREKIARYEDAGHGACWLAVHEIGRIVEGALLHFDGARYLLLAWCVMPNHVPALAETVEGFSLSDVVHSWKSFTAKEANRMLGHRGEFWMADYYDRFIRNDAHMAAAISYIEANPVKAGLVTRAVDWPLSSALRRHAGETPAVPGRTTLEGRE